MEHALYRLPVELLDTILSSLQLHDLATILRVNHALHSVSLRILYRSLPEDLSPVQTIQCLQTTTQNDIVASLVRSLHIDWADLSLPSVGLLRLLHRALCRLSNLTVLSLELSSRENKQSLAWIFHGCSFTLNVFISSIRCDQPLADFLHSQPHIVELGLRGFETLDTFTLQQSSLPNLQSLRVVRAGASILESVVRGRPVENVSVTIAFREGFRALDVLKLSSKEVRRLTAMAFELFTPEQVLTEIGSRMPNLVSLHIVILNSAQITETPQSWSELFSPFTRLQHFTFMASSMDVQDEISLASDWHKFCPSLKTVILPGGRVLIVKNGKWSVFS